MPYRVLVIDDNPSLLRDICDTLEQSGFYLHCSMTAADAMQVLETARYDAIITDIFLAHGEGFDVVEMARQQNIPVVVISGDSQAITKAARLGVPGLLKPFPLEKLITLLNQEIERQRVPGVSMT
jgi:DNA-binding response OmpR family regulator